MSGPTLRAQADGLALDPVGPHRPALLRASGVTKTYRVGDVAVPALRDFDLVVHPGELVGAQRIQHRPSELSGGEQQRVTIARALAARPQIVWADEPTGNLDSAMADSVMDLLVQTNSDDGQTIVLVTHDHAIGERVPRLITMRDGRLVTDTTRSPVAAGLT